MKPFKKNEQGLFVCEECERTYKNVQQLSTHINKQHFKSQIYFDKWIRDETDGICKICNKETRWNERLSSGYACTCGNNICIRQWNIIRTEQACIEKFGVKNNFQRKECIEKIKETKYQNHGDEHYNNIEKNKQTCQERYGVENVFQNEDIKQKCKQTSKENYGTENNMQSEKGKEEFAQSMLKIYGVEYAMQNPESHIKQQKSALQLKYFRETDIYYRGSFELDFLEKNHNRYPDIINAPSIKYMFEGKIKVYFPDFYIESLNLIIEIKNSHLAIKDKDKIEAKKHATLSKGFNYVMIIDKDYSDFELFLTSHGIVKL